MWPDRVSNPGPVTYKSGALPAALRGPEVLGTIQNHLRKLNVVIAVNVSITSEIASKGIA